MEDFPVDNRRQPRHLVRAGRSRSILPRTVSRGRRWSHRSWSVFLSHAVAAAGVAAAEVGTPLWFWDEQMTAWIAHRASMPPHYSTGALDPKIAAVRQQLERRRWTFRNLPRMNALPGLVRLHVNRRDVVANWGKLLTRAVTDEQETWAATADDRRKKRPRTSVLNEKPRFLLDG